jgi:hypothetical protein
MGTQGRREDVQHHAGAGMKQRHQMSDGKAAPGLLAAWLANMGVQVGGIRHRKTGAIDPKGAMTAPTALRAARVVSGRSPSAAAVETHAEEASYGPGHTPMPSRPTG